MSGRGVQLSGATPPAGGRRSPGGLRGSGRSCGSFPSPPAPAKEDPEAAGKRPFPPASGPASGRASMEGPRVPALFPRATRELEQVVRAPRVEEAGEPFGAPDGQRSRQGCLAVQGRLGWAKIEEKLQLLNPVFCCPRLRGAFAALPLPLFLPAADCRALNCFPSRTSKLRESREPPRPPRGRWRSVKSVPCPPAAVLRSPRRPPWPWRSRT